MNKHTFTGNLGADAQVRTLDNGSSAISFNVAVTEKFKDRNGQQQELTTWVGCTYWRTQQQGTAVAQYLKKGTRVLIEGRPSVRMYEKSDGTHGTSLDCRVETLELIGGQQQQQAPAPVQQPQNTTTNTPAMGGPSDDLPF